MNSTSEDPITLAIALGERLREVGDPADLSRLHSLLPHLEEALPREPDGERFALAILALFKVLVITRRLDDAPALLRSAHARARTLVTKCWVGVTQAQMLSTYNRNEDALALLQTLDPDPHEQPTLFVAYCYTAVIANREHGRMESAMLAAQRGIEVAQRSMVERGLAMLLNALGGLFVRQGDYARAISKYEEAISVAQRLVQDSRLLSSFRANLAATLTGTRRYEESIHINLSLYEESMRLEDTQNLYVISSNLAHDYVCLGATQEAITWAQRSLELFADNNGRIGRDLNDLCLGLARWMNGESYEADLERAARFGRAENSTGRSLLCSLVTYCIGQGRAAPPEYHSNEMVSASAWASLCDGVAPDEGLQGWNALEVALWKARAPAERAVLCVEGDMAAVSVRSCRIELTRRHIARKIMRALVAAYPAPVGVWELFEATWPDVVVRDAGALNRLYTAVHRLRAQGLSEVLVFEEDGYRILALHDVGDRSV